MRLAKRSFAWNALSCAMQSSALQGMRRRRKAKQSKVSPFKALLPPVPEVKGDALRHAKRSFAKRIPCKAPLCKAQRMGFAPSVQRRALYAKKVRMHRKCNVLALYAGNALQSSALHGMRLAKLRFAWRKASPYKAKLCAGGPEVCIEFVCKRCTFSAT